MSKFCQKKLTYCCFQNCSSCYLDEKPLKQYGRIIKKPVGSIIKTHPDKLGILKLFYLPAQ